MRRYRLIAVMAMVVLVVTLYPTSAYAYIDPSPIGSIFPIIAPIIALFLGFLAFMIRPIRTFFSNLFSRLLGSSEDEALVTDDQSTFIDLSDDEENGQSTDNAVGT